MVETPTTQWKMWEMNNFFKKKTEFLLQKTIIFGIVCLILCELRTSALFSKLI